MGDKKVQEEIVETDVSLSGEQYWHWRFSVEDLNHAKTRLLLYQTQIKLKEALVQKNSVEVSLLREKTKDYIKTVDDTQEEYSTYLEKVENDLGVSLRECIIDPYTYQVKEIKKTVPEEPKP